MNEHCRVIRLSRCNGLYRQGSDIGCPHYPKQKFIEFTGHQVRALRRPIVYEWLRQHSVIYVGMSRNGLSRPFGQHEHLKDFGPNDVLRVYRCESVESARRFERRLIRRHRPLLNKEWNPAYSKFAQGFGNAPRPSIRRRFDESELGQHGNAEADA